LFTIINALEIAGKDIIINHHCITTDEDYRYKMTASRMTMRRRRKRTAAPMRAKSRVAG